MLPTGEGRITVISGPMFSGKSSDLQRRVRRALIAGRDVQVFTSALDDRDGYGGLEKVTTHDGRQLTAEPVRTAADLRDRVRTDAEVVAIDEVQFLDDGIVDVVQELADRGIDVVCAGIDQDYRALPFGPIGSLMAIAEGVVKLDAVCVRCGRNGTRNQRLIDGEPAPADGPTVLVGATEHYEARCRRCHEVPETASQAVEEAA